LRAVVADRRLADPKRLTDVRQELGIDLVPTTEVPQG
jgi:hypothetical protein